MPSDSPPPSLLMVTTVATTIHAFLGPFARHLRTQGWRVDAAANGVEQDETVRADFDRAFDLPLSRSMRDGSALVQGYRSIERRIRGYDIVHVHTPIAGFLVRAAAHRLPARERPKVVYTAHGFHFHEDGRWVTNLAFLTAERVAGRWTDRLVVINAEDAAAAIRAGIVPRRRLVSMPGIGIDTAWYSRANVPHGQSAAVRQEFGIPDDAPLFVVVGELNRNKRPLDVVAALDATRDPTTHLLFLGRGSEEARIVAEARSRGLAARIHLGGMVDDVRPYVAAATALVLASRREGLPRAIMEALALEVPVITSRSRGSPQLVGTDAGIIVPIGDPRALARGMDRFVDDPALGRRMGQAGRLRMQSEYALELVLQRHDDMYRDLLTERKG